MEIILNKSVCKSFTGALSKTHGYSIRQRGNRFFGCRQMTRKATADGHWQFIVSCAQIAQYGLYICNIIVSPDEVRQALAEAGRTISQLDFPKDDLNAEELLAFKNKYRL